MHSGASGLEKDGPALLLVAFWGLGMLKLWGEKFTKRMTIFRNKT